MNREYDNASLRQQRERIHSQNDRAWHEDMLFRAGIVMTAGTLALRLVGVGPNEVERSVDASIDRYKGNFYNHETGKVCYSERRVEEGDTITGLFEDDYPVYTTSVFREFGENLKANAEGRASTDLKPGDILIINIPGCEEPQQITVQH